MKEQKKFNKLWDELMDIIPLPLNKAYKPYIQELAEAYKTDTLTEIRKEVESRHKVGLAMNANDVLSILDRYIKTENK